MLTVSPQLPKPVAITPPSWQQQLRDGISDPVQLLLLLDLAAQQQLLSSAAMAQFQLRVPMAYIARMQAGNLDDPLLRQVLPVVDEELHAAGFTDDPVADLDYLAAPGLIHKYHGRVLLIATGACAIHCRYCFRRAFPYNEQMISAKNLQQCLDYISNDASITEVILSGGDPLLLSTEKLRSLTSALEPIPHVQRLRIHTRLPVVIPDRVDEALCSWLAASAVPMCVVLHINHAREIDASLHRACRRLRGSGVTLLNQTVLLRGVNDSAVCQIGLAERLYEAGVLPYYLHQLDQVSGASHFQISDARAAAIHARMRQRLPGYLLPRLVRDIPGEPAKSVIREPIQNA